MLRFLSCLELHQLVRKMGFCFHDINKTDTCDALVNHGGNNIHNIKKTFLWHKDLLITHLVKMMTTV